jgi:hypothetical protein
MTGKRIEAMPPKLYRVLGIAFVILMLIASCWFISVPFMADIPNRQSELFHAAAAAFLFPLVILLIGPPCFLGYYPRWVCKIIPEPILRALIQFAKGDISDLKKW